MKAFMNTLVDVSGLLEAFMWANPPFDALPLLQDAWGPWPRTSFKEDDFKDDHDEWHHEGHHHGPHHGPHHEPWEGELCPRLGGASSL